MPVFSVFGPEGRTSENCHLLKDWGKLYAWSEATLIMPVVKPQPPPQPAPSSSFAMEEMKLWSCLSGKRFLRCLPWDGCWQPLISVTMEISPSPPVSPPPAVCQSVLFAKIAAAVHPPPFLSLHNYSSLNLLSGLQMPALPVRVQIILRMRSMPERVWACGSVV